MKIINGHTYSKNSFEDYKLRVKLEIIDTKDEEHQFDIYTTQTSIENIRINLLSIATDKVVMINIIHYATKEQDDMETKFIEETLRNL